jgi:DNA (cytosine-5)-methyltransferase 1
VGSTMKHYGDVSKINGGEIEPVDVITFGSPCQDMSVAGKRSGMKHSEQGDEETTRSGLFYEAVRIIEEMRDATNGEYPKYAVWENVPGAFSSNKGRDFHAVLEALCSVCDDTVSIPEPYDRKRTKLVWNKAGEIVGDNYSIAWRTLDAQYWGVPQRRKRIYLVADFTGRRAGEILFKPESLRGDMSQSNETGQEVAADAMGGVDGSVGVECLVLKERAGCEGGGKGALWSDKAFTLATNQDMSVIALQANGIDRADTAGAVQEAYTMQRSDEYQECNVASTQSARQYKSATDLVVEKKRKYIIRRLTPTECARLQGFPDKWGQLAPYDPADAEFWEDVRNGIAEQGAKTLGSLFDGSGGFPLAGVLNGIEPIWASEIEPYPIAVTKSRFKEDK